MATTIKLKNGSGAPLAGDLVQGEPALDLTNKRLYTENASGTVIEVGTNPSTLTVDTDVLVVDATNNRVGIGTTSIATKLNIRSDASDDGILLEKTDGTDIARLFHDGVTTNARLDLFSGGSATVQIRANGDTHFSGGNVGIGTTSPDEKLEVYQGNIKLGTATNTTSKLIFERSAVDRAEIYVGSSNQLQFDLGGSERMRIDSSGNVGIGTTEPEAPLTVKGASGAVGTHENQSWHYSTLLGDEFDLKLKQVVSAGLVKYTFDLRNSGDSYNNNLVLDRGKVGIGTTNPISKLHVDEGNLILESNSYGNTGLAQFFGTAGNEVLQIGTTSASQAYMYTTSGVNLLFYVNTAERMRIDTSGNLGIGTTSPTASLHVGGTASGIKGRFSNDIDQTLDLGIVAGAGSAGSVYLDNPNSGNMQFRIGNTERMRIDSNGGLEIKSVAGSTAAYFGGGNVVNGITGVPSAAGTPFVLGRDTGTTRSAHFGGHLKFTSGYGIDFDVSGGSGTVSSNVLDDYEEGTFTAYLGFSGGDTGSLNYTNQTFVYTKIGRVVNFSGFLTWNANNFTASSGRLYLRGLPFAIISGGSYRGGANINYANSPWTTITVYQQTFRSEDGTTDMTFNFSDATDGSIDSEITTHSRITSSGNFMVSGTYMTS